MTLDITVRTTKPELTAEVRRLEKEFAEFRKDVAETALHAKDEQGWCNEGFREAVEALGIGDLLPSTERLVTIVVLTDAEEYGMSVDEMDEDDWAEAAISKLRYASIGDLESYQVNDAPKDN